MSDEHRGETEMQGEARRLDEVERAGHRIDTAKVIPRAGEEAPDGWQGTPPAEGTRRRLIVDTIAEAVTEHFSPHGGTIESRDSFSLKIADAVEAALLKIDIGADPTGETSPASDAMGVLDAMEIPATREGAILDIGQRVTVLADQLVEARRQLLVRQETIDGFAATISEQADQLDQHRRIAQEAKVPAGTSEIHIVTTSIPDRPEAMLVEIENQHGHRLDSFERRQDGEYTRIVIPYGRHDGWVASLVHRVAGAAVAGEPSGIACRRLLEEVGVRPLCDRHAEEELAKGVKSAPGNDHRPPDEFDVRILACERLRERLEDGPVPNCAELARVIDVLR